MKNEINRTKIFLMTIAAMAVAIISFGTSSRVFAAPKAIFTSNFDCTVVNANIYDNKNAVYLNGGPNGNNTGFEEGDYYVQVTEPNGAVLGRSLTASVHVNANGAFAQCYQLSAILFKNSNSAPGYDTTTNNGGEYKAWVSQDPNFANKFSKTDNFKVKPEDCVDCQPPPPTQITISGFKFYDYNQNGIFDDDEQAIPGWKMTLSQSNVEKGMTETDLDGKYEFVVNINTGNYVVKEELRSADNWKAITVDMNGNAKKTVGSAADTNGVNFGNIRQARVSGLKFKDSNMNGVQDMNEGVISDIEIKIATVEPTGNPMNPVIQTVNTGMDGSWSSDLHPLGTTYTVCENVNSAVYLQTAPAGGCHSTAPAVTLDLNASVDVGGLDFGNIPVFSIGGVKFYDTDLSGTFTGSDTGLAGIKITVTATLPNGNSDGENTTTGAGGAWTSKLYPEGTTYTVTETLPPNTVAPALITSWTQVANRGTTGTVNGSNASADFLNVCSATPGGHTLGFWSNKNGQALITAGDFTRLNGYSLRNANGMDRDFNESTLDNKKKALNSWILSANATNMAYMLSAQMTATDLSANHNFTDPSVFVDGNRTVAQEILYANSLLAANANTTASGAARTEQGRVKDILDKINNGGSFKQPVACSVKY